MNFSYENKHVLITGGLGFIGSNLARALVNQGAVVTLVDSLIPEYGGNLFNIKDIESKVKLNICDVRDPFAIAHLVKGKGFLFNLAGQTSHLDSMENPVADLDINAGAQLSILEACKKNNRDIKIVFASTRQIYGKPEYLPVDERHPIRPVDVNGINKLAGEWYHILYNNVYGIRACALRLTNTYGAGMRVKDARQTFLGIWIRRLIEGRTIAVYGGGAQLRDFTYVNDCVHALMLAGAHEGSNGNIYNLGGAEVISLNKLAELCLDVAAELNLKSNVTHVAFPPDRKAIDIGDFHSDFALITNHLGWMPTTLLRYGLQETISYYLKNQEPYWDATKQ
jgi:dTDP-glucose 4,6-dehydratase/UDP-glucose 4-epimerase